MESTRSHRMHPQSPDRAVVALDTYRPAPRSQKQLGAVRRDPGETRAFAGKIELAASMAAALGAESACLRVPIPAGTSARLALIEAELEMLAHDIREAGGLNG